MGTAVAVIVDNDQTVALFGAHGIRKALAVDTVGIIGTEIVVQMINFRAGYSLGRLGTGGGVTGGVENVLIAVFVLPAVIVRGGNNIHLFTRIGELFQRLAEILMPDLRAVIHKVPRDKHMGGIRIGNDLIEKAV